MFSTYVCISLYMFMYGFSKFPYDALKKVCKK